MRKIMIFLLIVFITNNCYSMVVPNTSYNIREDIVGHNYAYCGSYSNIIVSEYGTIYFSKSYYKIVPLSFFKTETINETSQLSVIKISSETMNKIISKQNTGCDINDFIRLLIGDN